MVSGRQVQTKLGAYTQSKTAERWLTSGQTLFNNKGQPIQQRQPYYDSSSNYNLPEEQTQKAIPETSYYDPLGRIIKVETADGFHSKTIYSPWKTTHYDANDTVLESTFYKSNNSKSTLAPAAQDALNKAAKHANTPDIQHLDSQARVFRLEQSTGTEKLVTQHQFDIQGRTLTIIDPRGIVSFNSMVYDMTNQLLAFSNVDSGSQLTIYNVAGNPVHQKTSFHQITQYDALQRPISRTIKGDNGAGLKLNHTVERWVYGTDSEANLIGQCRYHYDSAGIVGFRTYTLHGKPTGKIQRLRKEYKEEANWPESNPTELLEDATIIYKTHWVYDAFGRVTAQTEVDGNQIQTSYHPEGWLKQVSATPNGVAVSKSIEYNAHGQATQITYGNGSVTTQTYDELSFLLKSQKTTVPQANPNLQNTSYTYDPVHNLTRIEDLAQASTITNQQQVQAQSSYTYDAHYRLIQATGREHPALKSFPKNGFSSQPEFLNVNNLDQLQTYTETYHYDLGDNLDQIQHNSHGAVGSLTQNLAISKSSNRAVLQEATTNPAKVDTQFDGNGNLKQLDNARNLSWNYRNNIASVHLIKRDGQANDAEYYVYDSSGQRIRKVTERLKASGVEITETRYLGDVEVKFIYPKAGGLLQKTAERQTLRIKASGEIFVAFYQWTLGQSDKPPQVRYQLENLPGSVNIELNEHSETITYEEYYPYGDTAYLAGKDQVDVKRKRYRFSGKERDAFTGLYYYGARYYAPWLGRWINPDPAGPVDGLNLYAFVGGDPINYYDQDGFAKAPKATAKSKTAAKKKKPIKPKATKKAEPKIVKNTKTKASKKKSNAKKSSKASKSISFAYESDDLSDWSDLSDVEGSVDIFNTKGKSRTARKVSPRTAFLRAGRTKRRLLRDRSKVTPRDMELISIQMGGHDFLITPDKMKRDLAIIRLKTVNGKLMRDGKNKYWSDILTSLNHLAKTKSTGDINNMLYNTLFESAAASKEIAEAAAVLATDISRGSGAEKVIRTLLKSKIPWWVNPKVDHPFAIGGGAQSVRDATNQAKKQKT